MAGKRDRGKAPGTTQGSSRTSPLAETKALGINASQAAEEARRSERWLQENAAAIKSYNEFVAKHGMVLDRYRIRNTVVR